MEHSADTIAHKEQAFLEKTAEGVWGLLLWCHGRGDMNDDPGKFCDWGVRGGRDGNDIGACVTGAYRSLQGYGCRAGARPDEYEVAGLNRWTVRSPNGIRLDAEVSQPDSHRVEHAAASARADKKHFSLVNQRGHNRIGCRRIDCMDAPGNVRQDDA